MELKIPVKMSKEAIMQAISKWFEQNEIVATLNIDTIIEEQIKPIERRPY